MEDFDAQDKELLLELAQHEFAHHVVARISGFKTGKVSAGRPLLSGPGGQAEIYLVRPLRTVGDVIDYSRSRIKVALAGVAGETLEGGKVNQERAGIFLTNGGGKDDYTKAREHLHLLRNLLHPGSDPEAAKAEIDALWNELSDQTVAIVEAEHGLIEALAADLAKKGATHTQPATFTEQELDDHPLIKARFRSVLSA